MPRLENEMRDCGAPPMDPGSDLANQDSRIELTLPLPPSTNHYYRNLHGKTLISKRGRAYRKEVAKYCAIQLAGDNRRLPLTDRLSVFVLAQFPDRRRTDLDNRLKPLLDALTHADVWQDDSQVDALVIVRGEISRPPSVTVTIGRRDGD